MHTQKKDALTQASFLRTEPGRKAFLRAFRRFRVLPHTVKCTYEQGRKTFSETGNRKTEKTPQRKRPGRDARKKEKK